MSAYLASFAVGLLVGLIYALLGVRSPAPPYIALLGLLGILIGESIFPMIKTKVLPPKDKHQIEAPASARSEK